MGTRYVLNHFYKLRHDIKRSNILSPAYVDEEYNNIVQVNYRSRIHPVFAMILSLFSQPITLLEAKKEVSSFLNIPITKAGRLIKMFLNNKEKFYIDYEGWVNFFPKNIIIEESEQFTTPFEYTPEQFAYKEIDLETERYYVAPVTLVFMVNNTCVTDCAYCYANKSIKCSPIPFDKVRKIVEEANHLHISSFSLVGGEVFLYKHWKELLELLRKNGLREKLISTKVPIKENDIIALKSFDLNIQVSLDTIDPYRLQKILNVNYSYSKQIQKTIELLDKHAVSFQIATVLTKYNASIECLEALHSFLSKFKHLRRWEVRIGFKSLYSRDDFDTIKLSRKEIEDVDSWMKQIKVTSKINISWTSENDNKYFKGENGSRSFSGARCSANYSNLFILPDGKVTICEQMYWDPRFIIGDLNTQTIEEVWNSPKSLTLAFPQKENFREKSICKTCDIFEECMSFPNRCIADILKGYGKENPDYPDPRCSRAPQFTHNLLNE